MKTRSSILSSKISPIAIDILYEICNAAKEIRVPFFIVGATARDIYFETHRATIDLDLGIQVADWKLYNELIELLISTGLFKGSNKSHRILYVKNDYPLDIIPFGLPLKSTDTITWPDSRKMTILGFEEAYQNSDEFDIDDTNGSKVRVASPVGLVIMKLISWNDSVDRSQKDAEDLNLIFSGYYNLNIDRIYNDYSDILELVDNNIERSGIVLLGRDSAAISSSRTKQKIKSIIKFQTDPNEYPRLAFNMVKNSGFGEINCENKLQMLDDFKIGFEM